MTQLTRISVAAMCLSAVALAWGQEAPGPGKSVEGLKLMLTADKDELTMTPVEGEKGVEGYTVEQARLSFTFVNTGRKPLKVIAHDLDWSLIRVEVKGPDAKSVVAMRKMIERVPPQPKDKDFPSIDPSRSWTARWQPRFPGSVGPVTYKLLTPGVYRLTATYTCPERLLGISDQAEGSWVGTVVSNDLALKLVLPPKDAPRGTDVAGGEPVGGLKLTLSVDKAVLKMTARQLRRAGEDTPCYDVEPARFTLTFANAGEKAIKLDAHALAARLATFDIQGPNPKSVVKQARRKALEPAEAKESDYPTIEPGKSWSCEVPATFPCDLGDSFFALQEPGEYRIKATYSRAEALGKRGDASLSERPVEKAGRPVIEGSVPSFSEGCWTGEVTSNEATVKGAEEGVAEAPIGVKEGGLKLELVADKTEFRMKLLPTLGADGTPHYQAEPVKLTFSFGNTGEKPVKLNTYQMARKMLTLNVKGPDAGSVRVLKASPKPAVVPTKDDYPVLEPNMAWTNEEPQDFPGMFGSTTYTIHKPGEYRLSLTYICEESDLKRSPLAAGSWVGTLTSDEIVVKAVVDEGK